jgi:hippurate hydrolase
MNLIDRIVHFQSDIAQIRRDLHAHPELRFEETRTAEIVATKLAGWGYALDRGMGKTGVVGTLEVGDSGRRVGLRADMDALPLAEANTFAHRSTNDGRMHACGHDGHTAMLLAAAQYLAESKSFDGTLHVIFQPAEEGGGGARVMMEDGLFEKFPCDAVFGMHNWPGAAVGTFGVAAGPMMASSNEFEITITGRGAHAAMPHNGVDPIMTAVSIAQALQTLITRNKKPIETAVLSITQIHAGDAYNIIPNEAVLRGTVRTFSNAVLDQIEAGMKRIVDGSAATFGADVALRFHRNYPPLVNHEAETDFCATVMRDVVGDDNVRVGIEPTMGSEDFAFMLEAKPGCYVFIGNGDGTHRDVGHGMGPCMLHNPSYDFNDALIPIGATYWVRLVEKFLAKA